MLITVIILLIPSSAVSYEFSSFYYNNSADSFSCNSTACVRKCCGVNYVPVHKTCVANRTSAVEKFLENKGFTNFRFFPGVVECRENKHYLLNTGLYHDDEFVLEEDGRIFLPHSNELLGYDQFCIDFFENVGVSALICFAEKSLSVKVMTGIAITARCSMKKFVVWLTVLVISSFVACDPVFYTTSALSSSECAPDLVCVRKCCAANYILGEKKCVLRNDTFTMDLPIHVGTDRINFPIYYTIGLMNCTNGFYKLEPHIYEDDAFHVQKNGSLWKSITNDLYGPHEYCVDDAGDGKTSVFICFSDEDLAVPVSIKVNAVGMIISIPFLLLTFLVYAILPDRNLHGKCLMCYVITLFGAYLLLIFIQLYPNSIETDACKALGIMCLFFFMVSFFWMSVMSIDIFLAFSGRRGFSGSRKEAERKRFLVYSAYAWGMPLLLIIVVTSLSVASEFEHSNAWYIPGMGDGQCWLREGIPTLVYFYLPMALLIIINMTLFCITACKIKQVQQDTAVLRKDESKKHSYENDKQRFNLYVKLLLAMGVNWSLEIVSWAVNWQVGAVPPAVWYLTDFCNALYGVFVFFIFVFKQNIWKLLKKRYYMMIGKPNLARTMTSAYSPRTTASSLNHTMTTDKSIVNDSTILTSEVA